MFRQATKQHTRKIAGKKMNGVHGPTPRKTRNVYRLPRAVASITRAISMGSVNATQ